MNLAGIRRVMELEEEVAHLRAELEEAAETASGAMAEAERRQRRDLVPLSQAVAIYGQWSRAEQDERDAGAGPRRARNTLGGDLPTCREGPVAPRWPSHNRQPIVTGPPDGRMTSRAG